MQCQINIFTEHNYVVFVCGAWVETHLVLEQRNYVKT